MFSPHVMAAMFGFPTAPKKKSPAPKKKKAENWFEKLKNDQLKELLRATQQTMSGTKDELVARLCSHPQMAEYAHEFRWPTPRCTQHIGADIERAQGGNLLDPHTRNGGRSRREDARSDQRGMSGRSSLLDRKQV